MFFTENSTSLASNIPAAVGYSDGCGAVRALIDIEQNRHSFVEAMMKMDYEEIQMRKSGSLNEAAITTLHEGALRDIWAKIVEMVKKFLAKIKAIFGSFIAKLSSLWMKDKDYVKKYKKDIMYESSRFNKMPVKWRKVKNGDQLPDIANQVTAFPKDSLNEYAALYKEDADDRKKQVMNKLGKGEYDPDNIKEDYMNEMFDDDSLTDYDFEELGINIPKLLNYIETFGTLIKKYDSNNKKSESNLNGLIKEAERNQKTASDAAMEDKGSNDDKNKASDTASHIITVLSDYQQLYLELSSAQREAIIICYKQAKAVVVKMASAGRTKKYEFANVLSEMAEDEVDEVISSAIDGKEAKELDCMYNKAPYDVLPPGTSNDPDELVYEPDSYTDTPCDTVSGSTGVDYVAKNEAFNFDML